MSTFNFDQLTPLLFQGSAPPCGTMLAQSGFRALVLAADEYQPEKRCFPGVQLYRAGIDDAAPTRSEVRRAMQAALFVVSHMKAGRPVLVTCHQGLNRSGLVSALALTHLGEKPERAIRHVQACRPNALFNKHFQEVVRRVDWRR